MAVSHLKKIIEFLAGVSMVVLMSVSFSGFTVVVPGVSDVVSSVFKINNPLVSEAGFEKDNILSRVCEYVYNDFSPLNEVISEAAIEYSGEVSVGDICSRVGNSDFLLASQVIDENDEVTGDVDIVYGDGYKETDQLQQNTSTETMSKNITDNSALLNELKNGLNTEFLIKKFYIVDSTTSIKKSYFNVQKMLEKDFSIKKSNEPKILIYHTHAASESYKDSKSGKLEEGIVGVGANVHTVTPINEKPTAQIMLFNGLSRNSKGDIKYLKNDNLADNLAFSLQLKLKAMSLYPNYTKPIYLKGYRYNLHLLPRTLLIELGNQNNTFEEACNAAHPLAEILDSVLSEKK